MTRIINSFFVATLILLAAGAAAAQTGGISGKVTLNTGTPLHDASVQIVQLKRTATTDDDGNFKFENVPAGRYTVLVHIEGFPDVVQVVDVAQSGTATANFEMSVTGVREQVTVTGSGTEQTPLDSFQTVNALSSSMIAERSNASLGEVLEAETGVAKRSFGVGSSRPVIRGFDGDRVLVLENGVRSGSVGSQSGDHGETVDTMNAERIEVVKGPGTLLYGSNAIGGVVNVIGNDENQSHEGFRGQFSAAGGTANREGAVSGSGEYGFGNWLFRGSGSAQRSGDYQTPIGRVQNSAARNTAGSFGAGYYGKKAYANATFTTDIRRYGIPYAALFEDHGTMVTLEDELPTVEDDIDIRQRSYNFRFSGGFRDLTNPFISGVQYNVDYTNYRHKELEIHDGVEEVGTIFDNKVFAYRSMFEQSKYKNLTGRFGFEGFNRDYQVDGAEQLITGKITQNSFSVFGLEEIGFERVKFQFGGRVERNAYKAENPEYRDRSFTGFSGAVGMNVSLWKGGAFVANYSNSYRAPALEELYNNGPHVGNVTYEIGNPNLTNERSNGFDVSVRHISDRFRLTGDVYYYRIKNFVYLQYQDEDGDGNVDIEDGLPVAKYEQNDAGYLGAELSADMTFNKWLGGFISADYVRAKLVDNDQNLPRIPPARVRAGFDVRYKGLSLRPEAVFAGRQEKTAPLELPTAGYGIFNIGGSYTIGGDHTAHIFTFNAYNLTDKLYRNHLSFIKELAPEMGRGIRFGYTVRFF